jgi:hypothetical protein
MVKPKLLLTMLAMTAGIVTAGATAAQAHDGDHGATASTPAVAGSPAAASGPAVFLGAELTGRNEVPVKGGPAVGDPDGRAIEVLRIQGNQVSFAVSWNKIGAPTASHVHEGADGVNGAVKIPFFGSALPATLTAATGTVTVTDKVLLDSLTKEPGKFYANLHTAEFPGGAVRGQLKRLNHPVDLDRVLDAGPLVSLNDGGQEVPKAGGPATGDPDGHATALVRADDNVVKFAFSWSGIGSPTVGHLHRGAIGINGDVAVELFNAPTGLPASLTGVAGTVKGVPSKVVKEINAGPRNFYTNLHTTDFPGGAVRGQLFRPGNGQQSGEVLPTQW